MPEKKSSTLLLIPNPLHRGVGALPILLFRLPHPENPIAYQTITFKADSMFPIPLGLQSNAPRKPCVCWVGEDFSLFLSFESEARQAQTLQAVERGELLVLDLAKSRSDVFCYHRATVSAASRFHLLGEYRAAAQGAVVVRGASKSGFMLQGMNYHLFPRYVPFKAVEAVKERTNWVFMPVTSAPDQHELVVFECATEHDAHLLAGSLRRPVPRVVEPLDEVLNLYLFPFPQDTYPVVEHQPNALGPRLSFAKAYGSLKKKSLKFFFPVRRPQPEGGRLHP